MSTADVRLPAEAQTLLLEVLRRQRQRAATPWPQVPHLRILHAEELKYGVRYSSFKWLGPLTEAQRQRFRRGLALLEERGLVIITRGYEASRITNIMLSEEGRRVAEQVEAEQNQAEAAAAAGGEA